MKKIFVFLFLLLGLSLNAHPKFWTSNPIPIETIRADSAHGFDVIHYDLTLNIDDVSHYIEGILEATIIAEENLTQVNFQLEELQINNIWVDDQLTEYTYENGEILIQTGLQNPSDEFIVKISYEGFPQLSDDIYHIGMIFRNNVIYTLSDPSGCRWWFPAYDYPWDKATFDFHITGRDDWLAACNGLRTSIVDHVNGTRTHNWEGQHPMATYLASVVFADMEEIYENYAGIPIQNFVPPSIYDEAEWDFFLMPQMMGLFSEKFGFYPFEKYGNAVVPMVTFGAMEHQTMTTLGDSYIDGNGGGAHTIAHEMAHQWFGNCLTPLTWKDVWLSEGFATYSESIYEEYINGYDSFINYVKNSYHNYYRSWMQANGPRVIYDPPYNETFAPPVYEKAASVLHMLRYYVGDETFFNILQTYFNEYQNSNVVTSEFIEVCEEVSGLDLTQFFQQWIFEGGLPETHTAVFVNEETSQVAIYSKTNCPQNTDFYLKMPLKLNYEDSSQYIDFYSSPNIAETFVTLEDINFTSYLIDPEEWILTTGNNDLSAEIDNVFPTNNALTVYFGDFGNELEIDGYNVFVSDDNENFVQVNNEPVNADSYMIENLTNGIEYFVYVKAVKNEFESLPSDTLSAIPIEFNLDQGVLIIDATNDGNGNPGLPTDEAVDEFYRHIINCSYTEFDLSENNFLTLEYLSNYSTVIWHNDDINPKNLDEFEDILSGYLSGGGNVIISGWNMYFAYNSLHFLMEGREISQNQVPQLSSVMSDTYMNMDVDQNKLPDVWNGQLPFVSTFSGEGIYYYQGDDSDFNGQCVGFVKDMNGMLTILGFPLYFMNELQAEQFIDQLLIEMGETSQEDDASPLIKNDVIIYPNPFVISNKRHVINCDISLSEKSQIEVFLFNLKGQRIIHNSINGVKGSNRFSLFNDVNDIPSSGIYLLKIKSNEAIYNKKITIIK